MVHVRMHSITLMGSVYLTLVVLTLCLAIVITVERDCTDEGFKSRAHTVCQEAIG